MKARLTEAQRRALRKVKTWSQGGSYMPFADEAASFEACERRGLLHYQTVDDGHQRNGYALTESGRAALEQSDA